MTFAELFPADHPKLLQLGETIRQTIRSLHSELEEGFYGGAKVKMASYSIGRTDNVVAAISPATDHIKLYLHHFDKVDTSGIKLVGKGKHARHVKLYKEEDFDQSIFKPVLEKVVEIVAAKK